MLNFADLNDLLQVQIVQAEATSTPTLIQEDLYFGRNIGTTGRVTEQQFQQFLQDTVTPRFPDGLTAYNAKGQFLDNDRDLIREPSKVLTFAYENNAENQQAINEIISIYKQQFQQESVLQVESLDVAVGFGQGEDVISNDKTPELIQVDLYFGRNIGTTGRVSDRQFSEFLRDEITPRFPDGLTVYDANGQFLDASNNLIREPSNVVSLILEDTQKNERALKKIINAYETQFQQESVLQVVNEEVSVGFGQGEDLIDNSPTSELIQVDLYFGRNIGTTGRVSDRQFRRFLRDEITPRFPDGLTVYDAKGQFLDESKDLIREPSKVVSLILEDTQKNERSINRIINSYKQQFQQKSVLAVVDETLSVAFDVEASPGSAGITFTPSLFTQQTQQSGFAASVNSLF
jgi:NADH:ubiquinone oxidoreductase subunit E